MAVQMNVAEAKAKLSELIARAEAGEKVIIARDGVPAVVLTPAVAQRPMEKRPIGFLSHLGPVEIIDPDWEAPDPADAEYAEQSFEADFAATSPSKTP